MAGFEQRLLDYLKSWSGKDDDEIGLGLGVVRNQVNQYARKLEARGLVHRTQGPRGKVVSYLISSHTAAPNAQMPSTPSPAPSVTASKTTKQIHDEEDWVKLAVEDWLRLNGWSVDVAWGRSRGIDILARNEGARWIIECKGSGSSPPMYNNYFLGALGELLQRMESDDASYALAFTDVPKFRRLWNELPKLPKERLRLSALFVSRDGQVDHVQDH